MWPGGGKGVPWLGRCLASNRHVADLVDAPLCVGLRETVLRTPPYSRSLFIRLVLRELPTSI